MTARIPRPPAHTACTQREPTPPALPASMVLADGCGPPDLLTAKWTRHMEARHDMAFQAVKRQLLGQKRRGRPVKVSREQDAKT